MRQTLVIAASVLIGCLLVGFFLNRPASAEAKPDPTAGRYQVVSDVRGTTDGESRVVVLDTATGQCWSSRVGINDWRDMGSPKGN
jgi:hypothetical protein